MQSTATEADDLAVASSGELSAETLDAIADLLAEGRSANTTRTYQAALRYWIGWHELRFGRPLPIATEPVSAVPVERVLQFIVDHVERTSDDGLRYELPNEIEQALLRAGLKRIAGAPTLNTTLLRLAVVAKAHQLKQLANPLEDVRVRELLRRVRRAYAARGQRPRSKKAVPKDLLQALLATCDDSVVGIRDRALLLFAWASGGRRRSEVASADMERLERLADGRFLYRLTYSKTNQSGDRDPNDCKPIVGAAAEALTAWLEAAQIKDGRIFRSIRRGKIGMSLSAHSVALIVKARARQAGLEGDFSGHSLRSGFITEAGRQAKPLADVMRLSGHRSVPQTLAYYQSGDVLRASTANLLDEPEPHTS